MNIAHLKAFKALKNRYREFNHEPIDHVFRRMMQVKSPELSLVQQPFQESWSINFNAEKQRLLTQLPQLYNLFHIGSTSIRGMTAKNVIDILLVTEQSPEDANLLKQLKTLGYDNYGVSPISGNAIWCWRILNDVSYVVHLCNTSNPCIELPVAFSQYLNVNTSAQQAYVAEKHKLLARNLDLMSYSVGKLGIYCDFFELAGAWKKAHCGELTLPHYETC
ncbi:GrpB family protein [Sessilibacter corallicola]|uniref:GrpB family protein n=1 Tax=Sessilibacter corallicola TaxID=2904075 RepID=UPI001E38427E|nr:GrpB family protein [Sessilibacter corallicola]MCE2026813.1 GrpB family protein [Sessilibacter corallicola]